MQREELELEVDKEWHEMLKGEEGTEKGRDDFVLKCYRGY